MESRGFPVPLTDVVTVLEHGIQPILQDACNGVLADTKKNLNSVPQLIQEKCREVADHLTFTQESSLTEIAEQLTEQLSLASNSTAAATPAPSTATFADVTARPSTDTVRPFGKTPSLFDPPVVSADKKALSDCKFALRIGKDAIACILVYGLDAVLKNSDNISEEDRESPAFHQLDHKMSVEGVRMPAPTGTADSVGTAEGYKGKHHQPRPPSTQSRPATTTRFNKGGPSSFYHKGAAPTTAIDKPPAMVNYMRSFGKEAAPIPEALAKPVDRRVPGNCWRKGCYGIKHSRWPECPKTAQYFSSTAMDTVSPSSNVSLHRSHPYAKPPPPPAQRR